MATYKINVRDSGGAIGQMDVWKKLTFSSRYNEAGPFQITVNYDHPQAALLQGGRTVDVERDGEIIFSGRIEGVASRVFAADKNEITWRGMSEEIVLSWRRALPVPGSTSYSSSSHDVQSGAGETAMKHYVDANAGPNARITPVNRRAIASIQTDLGRGASGTWRARFDKLDDLLRTIAMESGLGFRVIGNQFQVYEPQDRSGFVKFSVDLGTISSFEYRTAPASANYAIVGGANEGTLRVFVEQYDAGSIVSDGLREEFVDRRDTADSVTMAAAANGKLLEMAARSSSKVVPLAAENMQVVEDYWVGDMVMVGIDGIEQTAIVREISITIDTTGETVSVSIGTEYLGNPFTETRRREEAITGRVARLELV